MAARDPLASARARLLQLKADHDAGKLDGRRYEEARRAVEREIGSLLIAGDEPAPARPSRGLVGVLAAGVFALAVAGYWKTGAPSLALPGAQGDAVAAADAASGSESGQTALQQIAAMVDRLAARLQKNPDDAQGWTMLARSYTVLGRFDEALPAYARAAELQPNNPQLLADYADAVAATKNSANNPQSIALIERALKADPKHPKALALSGTVAYERGDYATAIAEWQKIADALPPGSETAERVQASIADAPPRPTDDPVATACRRRCRCGWRRSSRRAPPRSSRRADRRAAGSHCRSC